MSDKSRVTPRDADNPVEEDRKEELLKGSFYDTLPPGLRGAGDDLARIEGKLGDLTKKVDGLEERVRALEKKG